MSNLEDPFQDFRVALHSLVEIGTVEEVGIDVTRRNNGRYPLLAGNEGQLSKEIPVLQVTNHAPVLSQNGNHAVLNKVHCLTHAEIENDWVLVEGHFS